MNINFVERGMAYPDFNRFFISLQPNQSSEQKTPTAARNDQAIARLSIKLMWIKIFAV